MACIMTFFVAFMSNMTKSVTSSGNRKARFVPLVVERLVHHFGSGAAMCRALGVTPNFATGWRREGFLPELWALEVERLNVVDEWGRITAYEVLLEAEAVRRKRAGMEPYEGQGPVCILPGGGEDQDPGQ